MPTAKLEEISAPVEGGKARLDEISGVASPKMSLGRKAIEVAKGAGKQVLGMGRTFNTMATFGLVPLLQPKSERQAEEEFLKYRNPYQRVGATGMEVAEMMAPVPGMQEVKLAATAPKLARLGLSAAKGAAEVGAKTFLQTGSAKEAAVAGVGAGVAGAATTEFAPGISKILKKLSLSQYGKVLHPLGRKAKGVGIEETPGVIAEGKKAIAGSKETLGQKFWEETARVGKKIEQEYARLDATTKTKLKPIYDSFGKWIEESGFTKGGAIKNPELVEEGMRKMQYLQDTLGPRLADALPSEVWQIRQTLDKFVFKGELTPTAQAANSVVAGLGNSIRQELSKQHPSVASLNDKYHMWRTVAELMERNIKNEFGKLQFARNTGAIGRFLVGAAVGAESAHESGGGMLEMGTAAVLMGTAMSSTAWRTVSAVTKAKIANMLIRGEGQAAAQLAARVTGTAMIAGR